MWAYGLHILLKNKHGIQNKCKDKEIGLLWHVVDGSLSDRPRFHTFLNSAFNLSLLPLCLETMYILHSTMYESF